MSLPAALYSTARVDGEMVYSLGVLDEISPQSQYTMNYKLDVPLEVARRSATANPTYPWHGTADLSCMRNQWAFTTVGLSGGFSNVHDSLPAIFTVANGLSHNTALRFVGIVDKQVLAGENKDPTISCTVGGIRSGVNTSSKMIPAGYYVIWDWPAKSGVGNAAVPKFTQRGVEKTAFMFRTLPLKRSNVFAILTSITSRFFNACNTASTFDLAPNRHNWVRVQDEIRGSAARIRVVKDALATAHHADVIISSTTDTRDVLKRFVNFLLVSIGANVDFNTHTVERDASDIFDDNDDSGYSGASVYAASASSSQLRPRKRQLLEYENTNNTPNAIQHSLRDNPMAFIEYPLKFFAELIDILNQRIMGECMLTSDAGGKLDLSMRCGRV